MFKALLELLTEAVLEVLSTFITIFLKTTIVLEIKGVLFDSTVLNASYIICCIALLTHFYELQHCMRAVLFDELSWK